MSFCWQRIMRSAASIARCAFVPTKQIAQACRKKARATDPFADYLRGRIELSRSRGFGHAPIHNGTNHFLSTFRGQASILMSVHSVLRESLRFGHISVASSDRMDNLPKVHN